MELTEQAKEESNKEFHPELACRVCNARLYLTDQGNHHEMFHCSSEEARYWDFDRGTQELTRAWNHWEKSGTVI
jgi:hypothetical protein